MKIKTFTSVDKANDFITSVSTTSIQYVDGKVVVMYKDYPTVKEMKQKKIQEEEAESLLGLEEAKMHLQYLEIVAQQSEEDAKIVEASIKSTKQNIKNYEAKLTAIELWKSA